MPPLTWFTTQTYLRFRAGWTAQGLDRNLLPFRSPLQPYAAWYGIVGICIILFFSGFSVFLRGNWNAADFLTDYLPIMVAPIVFGVASYVMKSKFIKPEDMDFITGVDEVIADSYDEPPPKNIWEKFWLWIVSTYSSVCSSSSRKHYSSVFTVLSGRELSQL